MSNDRPKRSGQDRARINALEGYERSYWARQLACTEQQLLEAISAVGPDVDRVRMHLNNQRNGGDSHLACA